MAHASADEWASDVPISIPNPATADVLLDLGGFAITRWGITHNLTSAQREALLHPNYGPPPGRNNDA